MAADIPPILLEFKADIKGIQQSLQTVEGSLKNFQEETKKSAKGAKNMGVATVAAGSVIANALQKMGSAMFKFGKETINAYSEAGKQTKQLMRVLGGTPEEMSRLNFATQRMGVSTQTLSSFMTRLGVHLSANDKAAARLGVAYRDANGKLLPSTVVLGNLADKFAKLPAGLDKSALAVKAFGRGGIAMLPILNKGSAGLQELYDKADKLGITLSGKNLSDVSKYTSAQKDLKETVGAIQIQLGKTLIPLLTNLTKMFADLALKTVNWVKQNKLLLGVITAIAIAIGAVIAAQKINVAWTKIQVAWNARATATTGLFAAAQAIATAASAAWSAVMAVLAGEMTLIEAPLWLIIAAILALVEVFFFAIRHSKPFADFLIKAIGMIGQAYGTVIKFIIKGITVWVHAWFTAVSTFIRLLGKLKEPLNKMGLHWADGLDGVADKVDSMETKVTGKLNEWADKAPDVGKRFGTALGKGIVSAANFDVVGWIKKKVGGLMHLSGTGDSGEPSGEFPTAADDGKGKRKKPIDVIRQRIQEIIAAVNKEDAQFKLAKAQMANLSFEEQKKVIKTFMENNARLIKAAQIEERKTRGTKNHALAVNALSKAIAEQAKFQTELNKVQAAAAKAQQSTAKAIDDTNNAQSRLNATMTGSNSWLAAQVRTAGVTASQAGSFIEVPVIIDGQTVFRVVQKHTLINNRRNVDNGLARSGSTIG